MAAGHLAGDHHPRHARTGADREDSLEAGDELLFVAAQAREEQLEDLLSVRKDDPAR